MKSIVIALLSVFCLSVFTMDVSAADVKLEIRLQALSAPAAGKAVYETRTTRRKLKVEGQDLGRFNGKTASVYVNNVLFATVPISLGVFKVERSTEFGQPVPVVGAGTTVLVKVNTTATTQVSVLSGRF